MVLALATRRKALSSASPFTARRIKAKTSSTSSGEYTCSHDDANLQHTCSTRRKKGVHPGRWFKRHLDADAGSNVLVAWFLFTHGTPAARKASFMPSKVAFVRASTAISPSFKCKCADIFVPLAWPLA